MCTRGCVQRPQADVRCLPHPFSTLSFESRSESTSWVHRLVIEPPGSSPGLVPHVAMGDLSSGPHACATSPLLTEHLSSPLIFFAMYLGYTTDGIQDRMRAEGAHPQSCTGGFQASTPPLTHTPGPLAPCPLLTISHSHTLIL